MPNRMTEFCLGEDDELADGCREEAENANASDDELMNGTLWGSFIKLHLAEKIHLQER